MKTEELKKLAQQALDGLFEQLAQGVSQQLQDYLRAMSRFRAYSLSNAILIEMQHSGAMRVAGYGAWRELGRQVKRGEHGITILAPVLRRAKVGNVSPGNDSASQKTQSDDQEAPNGPVILGFRPVHVFDISQTEGQDLPQFTQVQGHPQGYLQRLKDLIASEGIILEYCPSLGGADGCSSPGKIMIRSGMEAAEEFGVLAHELAHQRMHLREERGQDHAVAETEAEAVASILCGSVGIDSRRSSADYIHLHQGDKQLFLKSLERIRRYAFEIIDSIAGEAPVSGPVRAGNDAAAHPGPGGPLSGGSTNPTEEMEPVMERNHNIGKDKRPSPRGAAVAMQMWRAATRDVPMDKLSFQEVIDMIGWCITRDVVAGFVPVDEIVDNVLEVVSGNHDPEQLRSYAEDLLHGIIQVHLDTQRQWPAVTDCDRLEAAFAKLEDTGIICRPDYTCCGKCGAGEIREEIKQQRQAGREVRGYVFYDFQDTQRAVGGDGLCLNYGSVLMSEKADVGIGWEIVTTLQTEGLEVSWDGMLRHRIIVRLDWKRRLPPQAVHLIRSVVNGAPKEDRGHVQ